MRGVIPFNVHARTLATPMVAAAAVLRTQYDQNNHHQELRSPHQAPHSPWKSPVPYLFGGLAAMLGLVAFALFILACSYWKLSGYLEEEGGVRDEDVEGGQHHGGEKTASSEKLAAHVYEQKIVVIMAGDEKPTYLATPVASRNNSFGDDGKSTKGGQEEGVVGAVGERKVDGEEAGRQITAAAVAASAVAVASKGGETSQVTTHREEQTTSPQDERMPQLNRARVLR